LVLSGKKETTLGYGIQKAYIHKNPEGEGI
jgi:hypothetical protein